MEKEGSVWNMRKLLGIYKKMRKICKDSYQGTNTRMTKIFKESGS